MYLHSLVLKNFRNYCGTEICWDPGVNIIVGLNAQGKSNLLEGICYLSTASSFRGTRDGDLIRWGQQFFFLEGLVKRKTADYTVSVGVSADNRKVAKINGNQRKKLSDFFGVFNTVIFSPEDLSIVKSGPAKRRRFLDVEMVQLFPSYMYILSQYQKILFQRNNLLRERQEERKKESLLAVWDQQLSDTGSKIIKKRRELLQKLAPLARLMHRKITDGKEELDIVYETIIKEEDLRYLAVDKIKNIFLESLLKGRREEKNRGMTLVGPHRDDLKLVVNNVDVRKFGSQGQQRTTALSLKMAELELMKGETSEYPVLLLDDVMSELDDRRRKHLLNVISGRVQTFITATDGDFSFGEALRLRINQGKVERY